MMPSGLWGPVVLGAAIRIALWSWVPTARFASDEQSYFRAGTALATQGLQDLFWPPMTGWVIAGVTLIAGPSLSWLRLVWVMLDIACLIAVRSLAWRIAPGVSAGLMDHQTGEAALARQFTIWATLGYALYLPAISFSQFATSETLALLQLLVVLLLLTRFDPGRGTFVLAGVITGTLVLTQPMLLPLLVLLPIAIVWQRGRTDRLQHSALVAVAGALVVGAVVIKNWLTVGEAMIARNSAYDLSIGNRDFSAGELDLFSPQATHSGTLAERALGRLGGVFAPRTDVLELVGGERSAGFVSPWSIALLGIANLQWTVVLFGGIIGLFALRHLDRQRSLLVAASVAGSLVLCLIAISKPRYGFVIDPLLLLGAYVFLTAPGRAIGRLPATDRLLLVAVFAFLIWVWIVWSVFAFTSRI